jgi:hypothetical protein
MQITHQGATTIEQTPRWVGTEHTCTICGCSFKLEKEDNVTVTQERHPYGLYLISLKCPGCGYANIHKPILTKPDIG